MTRLSTYEGFDLSCLEPGTILSPEQVDALIQMNRDPNLDQTTVLVVPDPMEAFGA